MGIHEKYWHKWDACQLPANLSTFPGFQRGKHCIFLSFIWTPLKIPLFMGFHTPLLFFSITNNSQHKHTFFFQALTVAPSMHFYPLCLWKMCWLSPTIDAYLPKGQSIPRELKQIQFYTNSIAINATSPAWLSLGHKAVTMDEVYVIKRHLFTHHFPCHKPAASH